MIPNSFADMARTLFKAMNIRNFTILDSMVHESIILDFPGVGQIEGPRRVFLFMKVLLKKYPRLEFDVSEVLVDGTRAVAVWTNSGEKIDGTLYKNSGMTLFHFEDEKIRFISDYFKDTSFITATMTVHLK